MSALEAAGTRVIVRPVEEQDLEPYQRAVALSRERTSRWNVPDPDALARHLEAQSDTHHTFVVHARERHPEHDLVSVINVTNIVRGRFQSANLGYDAYDPYAGRGLFREGLALVVGLVCAPVVGGGIGLHRVEANVQPGNARSAMVLRSLGFRHEGRTPRMLRLPGPDGAQGWRDHERYAVTAPEWPAAPFATHTRTRQVVLVNGLPGSGKTMLAHAVAAELALPMLSTDMIEEAVAGQLLPDDAARPDDAILPDDAARLGGGSATRGGSALAAGAAESIWSLLGACPDGAVVENSWASADGHLVEAGLRRAGFDPADAVEVWCDVPLALARERFEGRAQRRRAVHGSRLDRRWWQTEAATRAAPLGLGTVIRVDTSGPLEAAAVVRLALAARASMDGH